MDAPAGRRRGLDEPWDEVRAGHSLGDRHAEKCSAPDDGHAVSQTDVSPLKDGAHVGVLQGVHEEVDVGGRDLVRAAERAAIVDQLADHRDRLAHAEVRDRHSEEQRRGADHRDVSVLRSESRVRVVRVHSTSSLGRSALIHTPTFHATSRGADSKRLVSGGRGPDRRETGDRVRGQRSDRRGIDDEGGPRGTVTERRPDRVDAGDGELHGREHRERRDEVIEDGVDTCEPTAARRAEPGEQPRHVSLGQLDAATLPSKVLARRLRHGLGHLGPQHGVGRVAHELPFEEQLIWSSASSTR